MDWVAEIGFLSKGAPQSETSSVNEMFIGYLYGYVWVPILLVIIIILFANDEEQGKSVRNGLVLVTPKHMAT